MMFDDACAPSFQDKLVSCPDPTHSHKEKGLMLVKGTHDTNTLIM